MGGERETRQKGQLPRRRELKRYKELSETTEIGKKMKEIEDVK